jgi:hypothetical protein
MEEMIFANSVQQVRPNILADLVFAVTFELARLIPSKQSINKTLSLGPDTQAEKAADMIFHFICTSCSSFARWDFARHSLPRESESHATTFSNLCDQIIANTRRERKGRKERVVEMKRKHNIKVSYHFDEIFYILPYRILDVSYRFMTERNLPKTGCVLASRHVKYDGGTLVWHLWSCSVGGGDDDYGVYGKCEM